MMKLARWFWGTNKIANHQSALNNEELKETGSMESGDERGLNSKHLLIGFLPSLFQDGWEKNTTRH